MRALRRSGARAPANERCVLKPTVSGKFSLSSLAEVIDALIASRYIGALLVSDGLSERCFYFSRGGVRLLSFGPRRRLTFEEVLVRKGLIAHDEIARLREKHAAGGARLRAESGRIAADAGMSLPDLLLETRAVDPEKLRKAALTFLEEELFDLFLWDGAQFEFYQGNPPREIYDPKRPAETFSLDLGAFFEDTRQKIQECRKIRQLLSSEKVVMRLTAQGEQRLKEGKGEPLVQRVLRLFEGEKRLEEILAATKIGQVDVLRTLHGLVERGELKIVRVDSERRDLEKEIAMMEEALDKAIGTLVVQLKLGRAYEDLGQTERASLHYKRASVTLLERDRDTEAIEVLTRVAGFAPNDFEAQERLTNTLFKAGRNREASTWGMKLGQQYRSLGLLRRALGIFQTLLSKDPENLEAHRLLVETLIDLGETGQAVVEGMSLASTLEKRELISEVFEIYKRLIAAGADPDLFRASVTGITARRLGVARRVVLPAAAGIVLAAALALSGFELHARLFVRAAVAEARELTEAAEFGKASATLRAAFDRAPFHPLSWDTEASLKALEEAEAYKRLLGRLDQAEELCASGEAERSLQVLRQVEKQAPDSRWLAEVKRRIEAHEAEAEAQQLARYAQNRLFSKEFDSARPLLLALAEKYPATQAASALTLPLTLDSSPRGADVILDGVPQGKTPLSIFYAPGRARRLEISLAGHRVERTYLTGLQPISLFFALRKAR